jgi:hypothetical protein
VRRSSGGQHLEAFLAGRGADSGKITERETDDAGAGGYLTNFDTDTVLKRTGSPTALRDRLLFVPHAEARTRMGSVGLGRGEEVKRP